MQEILEINMLSVNSTFCYGPLCLAQTLIKCPLVKLVYTATEQAHTRVIINLPFFFPMFFLSMFQIIKNSDCVLHCGQNKAKGMLELHILQLFLGFRIEFDMGK